MRYSAVFKGLTKEEATEKSERLLEGVAKGERVVLMAENDNQHDALAVISYMKGNFYGRVKAAMKNIVRMLMKDEQVEARYLCGSHVTYFVEIEVDGPLELQWEKLYSMDNCPLSDKIVTSMPLHERRIAADESEFRRLIAEVRSGNLDCTEVTKLREDFLSCAERMVDSLGFSLSRESEFTMSFVATSLMMLVADPESKEWGGEKLEQLAHKAERKSADSTRDTGEAIFNTMLDSALNDTAMLARYERAVGCTIAEMKAAQKKKCVDELKDWLKKMTTLYDLLTPLDNNNMEDLAKQIRYLAIARTDIYRVMAVVALVKKLEEKKKENVRKKEKKNTHKKNLFKGMSEEQKMEMKRKYKEMVDKDNIEYLLNCDEDNPLIIAALKFLNNDCQQKGKYYATEVVPFIMEALNIKKKDIGLELKSISNVISHIKDDY